MEYSASSPPQTLCILRLSALGDITHVLPTLRTLQKHWPTTRIVWIIGKIEYQLVKDIDDVEFILFDKNDGLASYQRLRSEIRRKIGGTGFDVLMHMQLSLRASFASLFIPARIKLGFDKARAKDLQSLFCNRQITPLSTRQHVVDSFLEFPRYFGLEPVMQWQLPVADKDVDTIRLKIDSDKALFVINPCAVAKAKNWRNWHARGYAAIADYVSERYDMLVVLCGGYSTVEKETALEIIQLCKVSTPVNLVAGTSIGELVALLKLAETVLAPDTGPVHIASALGTKTIGLYATTNPERAGPYNNRQRVVNRYPDALSKFYGERVESARWGKRIKTAEGMQLITIDEVKSHIDASRDTVDT